jgi:hypothetical protein
MTSGLGALGKAGLGFTCRWLPHSYPRQKFQSALGDMKGQCSGVATTRMKLRGKGWDFSLLSIPNEGMAPQSNVQLNLCFAHLNVMIDASRASTGRSKQRS